MLYTVSQNWFTELYTVFKSVYSMTKFSIVFTKLNILFFEEFNPILNTRDAFLTLGNPCPQISFWLSWDDYINLIRWIHFLTTFPLHGK